MEKIVTWIKRHPVWAILFGVLTMGVLFGIGSSIAKLESVASTPETATPTPTPTCDGSSGNPTFAMPDFSGMKVAATEEHLASTYVAVSEAGYECDLLLGYDVEILQSSTASSLAYMQDTFVEAVSYASIDSYDTTGADVVVATAPAVGVEWHWGDPIRLFVLKQSELDWYEQHPTMPEIPAGTPIATLLADGGVLDPVLDLMVPMEAGEPYPFFDPFILEAEENVSPDPRVEPVADANAREGYRSTPINDYMTVLGTIPAAGEPLRLGQPLLVVFETNYPAYVPGPDSGSNGGSDWDVNVSIDWNFNCPWTRWC